MILSIDIETYSSVDLKKSGAYAYAQAPDFTILLLAYALDEGDVKIVDIASGEALPATFERHLKDPRVTKSAFNANFERVCINQHFNMNLDASQWQCTAVLSHMAGLPGHLAGVAQALKLSEQKSTAGSVLIKYFCMPCKPTKINGQRTRNLPKHDVKKWELFKEYCIQDVVTERAVRSELLQVGLVDHYERDLYALDQKINDRGVMTDLPFVNNAIKMDEEFKLECQDLMRSLTGLANPNSVAQLKEYLGVKGSLCKEVVTSMLKDPAVSEETKRLLEIRRLLGKSSTAKYVAMANSVGEKDRIRGTLQFMGAGRTGRWAGRIVQIQNLPRNYIEDLEGARDLVVNGDREGVELLYGGIPQVLSELVRTSFIAPHGKELVVADFSAIEARVISWLAGEKWRMDVFAGDGKIYEASASAMFGVDIDTIVKGHKNYELRAKGKVAELACGYQGGVNALVRMGGESMGLSESEMGEIVNAWREANPNIVKLWRDIQKGVKNAIGVGYGWVGDGGRYLKMEYIKDKHRILNIQLPSGRKLAYYNTRLEQGDLGPQIAYDGLDSITKQWHKTFTYGGKLAENCVQAIARDCLAEAMLRIDKAGYDIVMHIHDEVVVEAPEGEGEEFLKDLCDVMGESIPWAPGLDLRGDGFVSKYYKKDG